MNREEFSASFDTLLNSYADKAPFGDQTSRVNIDLDEWEKSRFLTDAQEELVLGLYDGRNSYGASFEETEELRRYLSTLVVEKKLTPETNSSGTILGMETTSKFFTLPENLWFITYERVNVTGKKCEGDTFMEVVPVRQDEYNKLKKNPFRGANDRRSLRLDLADGVVEVVSKYEVQNYYIRYIKKVKPILLVDMPEGLNISGETTMTPEPVCELPEMLHRRILENAVLLAIRSKGVGLKNSRE